MQYVTLYSSYAVCYSIQFPCSMLLYTVPMQYVTLYSSHAVCYSIQFLCNMLLYTVPMQYVTLYSSHAVCYRALRLSFALVGCFVPLWLYATPLNISPDWSNLSSPFLTSKIFKNFQVIIFFQKCSSFSTVQSYASNAAFHKKWKESSCWRGNPRLGLKCTLSSRVVMLPIQLKYFTLSSWLSIIFRTGEGYIEILFALSFTNSFPFHNICQFQSVYQLRRVAAFLP
jgi:hypothetical protein